MRGYYEGRYRDKCAMDAQIELRQLYGNETEWLYGQERELYFRASPTYVEAYPSQLWFRLSLGI